MSDKTPSQRYDELRTYLNRAANWEAQPSRSVSFYARQIREEWRGRYLVDALEIIEELLPTATVRQAEPLGLTQKQRQVFDYIKNYQKDKGCSPSLREISEAFGLRSRSGAHRILNCLKDRGFIDWRPGTARSIAIRREAA